MVVYLSEGNAITFKIKVKEKPKSIQIGAKSPNSSEYIDAKKAQLVVSTVGNRSTKLAKTIDTATDMYYDITSGVVFTELNDGYEATIVIGNPNNDENIDTAILSLTNLKLKYSNEQQESSTYEIDAQMYNEAKAYAIDILSSVQEDTDDNVSVETPGEDTEDGSKEEIEETPNEPEKEVNLEIQDAKFNSKEVSIFNTATLIVKTTEDVKSLGILDSKGKVVNPTSVSSTVENSIKTWKVKIKLSKLGNTKFAVYGIGEDGTPSNKVVETSVKCVLFTSISNLFKPW